MIVFYHNNRCKKSREALELVREKTDQVKIIDYLKIPPTEKELSNILKLLGIPATDLIRKNEDLYKTKFKDKILSNQEWIKILHHNPILIERPIIINGNKAIIGRPIEKVIEFI